MGYQSKFARMFTPEREEWRPDPVASSHRTAHLVLGYVNLGLCAALALVMFSKGFTFFGPGGTIDPETAIICGVTLTATWLLSMSMLLRHN